ncbi:methyltransferase domain-containing protein [Priestia megaterium]|uniref:methyltransferase domain-containing protein n=1 Tax=Priestia megaterium TaxID=1404 RepID=UPI00300A4D01
MFQKEIWDTLWGQQKFSDWDESAELVYSVLKKEIGDFKEKRILEAGSGTGRISLALAKEGAKVTLMDFSETALLQSEQRFKQVGLHAEFILADIFNMESIPDNTYDVVWNAGVIEHFDYEQQLKALDEMNRVLKPNGILITLNPNAKCLPYQLGKWFMESTEQWPYGQELPIFSLEGVCKEVGMTFIREYSVGLEQSLNFLSQIPNSNFIKNAFEKWSNSLNEQYKENMEGYLKVTICKKTYEKEDVSEEGYKELYSIRENQKKKNIIMLSSVHFLEDLWQRHQQLATEFINKGYQVIFVNNRSTILNINIDFSKMNDTEIKYFFSQIVTESPIVNGILMINRIDFLVDSTGQKFNIKDTFINFIISFFHNSNTNIITYLPEFSNILSNVKKQLDLKIYYDCVDEMTGFYNTKKVVLDENKLLEICDGVIVTSNTLFVRKGIKNKKCILVPNGVNYKEYRIKKEKPIDLQNLRGPIIGYVGAIAHWFDQELICKLAEKHPNWNFVLIGTVYVNVDKLKLYSNIHILGKREYNLVPNYMQYFDVGIIPFKDSELIVNTNPIKYYEYVAASIPVVSTIMPELIGKPYVYVVSSLEEFNIGLENALGPHKDIVDVDYLKENSWYERSNKIIKFVEDDLFEIDRKSTLLKIINIYEGNKDNLPILYLLLAEIFLELGEDNKSKQYLNIFTQKAPQQSPLTQIRLFLHFKELGEVKRVLMSMNGCSNYDTEIWNSKGDNYLKVYALRKISEYEEALTLADQILEEDDRSFLEEVGNIYYDVEQYDDAFKFYIEAFSNKGKINSLEGAINFANLLKNKGEIELAKKVLEPHSSIVEKL